MDENRELVQKLADGGCPNCGAKIEMVDGSLQGARLAEADERFDGPALIVCLACGHGVRLVGPKRLPHRARRIV
jgi:hypothetical protein